MSFTTTNMSLVIPSVLTDVGPTYATLIDAAFVTLDAHNHSSGSGVQITPSGLNISSDLTFNQNNATNLRTARLYNNSSITLGVNDKTCLYALNGELYYEDAAGNTVQVTLSGSLNVGTLTALAIKDSLFQLQYFGDTSRILKFSAANVPASTTNTFIFPAISGTSDTVASLTAVQTLTNTTLTNGTVSGATATTLISGSGTLVLPTSGTVTVPSGTATLVNTSGTQTLTNKNLGSSTNTLTGATMASFTPDGTHTITVPSTTDTLAGLTAVQTLTNKTLTAPVQSSYEDFTEISTPASPSSGVVRIYSKSDNNMYYLNSSGLEQQIGSGSSSGINYISNGSFENGTVTGWATYANTAQSTPVNGTGGSPNVTFASSSSSPLRGTYSGLFTKGAVNYQGQGVSYAFTLASVDTGKTLQLTMDASASANFASGDMGVYLYDITNSVLITPNSVNIPTGVSSQYSVAFSTTTSTSYRLIFHVQSTNASAYTLQLDQMSLSPVVRPIVAGESDWIAYTPTTTGFGTPTNVSAFYKRVGDTMYVSGSHTTGTSTAVLATISLPTNLTINSSKLSLSTTSSNPSPLIGQFSSTGTGQAGGVIASVSTSTSLVYFGGDYTAGTLLTPNNGNNILANNSVFSYQFQIPITQWSSNITLASTTPMIEFVSNNSGLTTAGGSNTSSFLSSAAGSAIGSIASTTVTSNSVTSFTCQFQNAIQPTDRIVLEVNNGTAANGWIPASSLFPFVDQGAGAFGMKVTPSTSVQVIVAFGNGGCLPTGTTYATAGTTWASGASGYYWRVSKYSSYGGTELAPATYISTGTITRENIWTAYTPTFSAGFGTVTNNSAFYKVLGDSLFVRGSCTVGTTAASIASVSIPTLFTISSSKLSLSNTTSAAGNILGEYGTSGASSQDGYVVSATGTSTSVIYFGAVLLGTSSLIPANGTAVTTTGDVFSYYFEVPLV